MKYRRIPSIRGRMTIAFAIAIAFLVIVSSLILNKQSNSAREKRARELLLSGINRTQEELNEADNRNLSLLDFVRQEEGELTTGNVGLLVLDSNNQTLWKSRAQVPPWPLRPAERDDWRIETLTARHQTLVMALPWENIEETLREREKLASFFALVLVLASAGGAWLLVGRTLSPIERLSQQAQSASAKGLKVRLVPPSRDMEIVGLVDTMNGLLERLEKEAAARGRFYAAASHELRTPLQALIGELDVILSRPRQNEEYQSSLETVQTQSLRLMSLVQELLQLNQLEMAAPPTVTTKVDIADITQRAFQPFSSEIARKSLVITSQLQNGEVLASDLHVEMLIRNLVENAVKYTADGQAIRLTLHHQTTGMRFTLWNGATIAPQEDLTLWFEPFFRRESARVVSGDGNGLGLAICRALCEHNGWQLALSRCDEGLLVEVVFPLAAEED